jgi:quercetin dioxygenase-like cupin family protein
MTARSYDVEKWETVAEAPSLRVIVISLSPGQSVPWHIHTQITDTFYCLEGTVVVEHRGDMPTVEVATGSTYAVLPNTPHYVHGKDSGSCKFLIVQGIGVYDFVPLED